MVCDDYRLFVLLLTTSSIVAAVSEETLNVYALLGSNLTLSLDQKLLSDQDALRWAHNNKAIFSRWSGVVRQGKPTDVDAAGSLQLLNLSISSAGDYKAVVYNRTGVRVNGWSGKVYVVEKVSTPVVTILCGSSGATVTLKCDVLNPKHVVYAWTHEGQLLTGETKPTLSVSFAKFKVDKEFGCSVSNSASKAQSNAVQLKCKQPPPPLPPPTPKDYCFKARSEETFNVCALLGSNLTLSLDQKLLSDQDTLRWTHNNKVIFSRLSGVVHRGKPTDVDAAGSLQLLNLSDSSAGDYKADVYDRTGVRANGWSGKVYVVEKVSTPVVTILCGSSGVKATLKCDVLNPKYVVYAWTHEGQLLTGETKPTLSVSLAKFKGDKGFGCSVSNSASKAQSNTVQLKCKPPPPPLPPPTPKDYCFKASTVMAGV